MVGELFILEGNRKELPHMSQEPRSTPSMFTHVDVSADATSTPPESESHQTEEDFAGLMRQMVEAQDRQNELLEELVHQLGASQRQRTTELGQWKKANPRLAGRCRKAAESLGRVQSHFLENLTSDITDNADDMTESDFMLNEFVDRYGPRLAHLNSVLQVLSQLSSVPNPTNAS